MADEDGYFPERVAVYGIDLSRAIVERLRAKPGGGATAATVASQPLPPR